MDEILSNARGELTLIFSSLVTALVGYGLTLAREYIKAQIAKIKAQEVREASQWALERLDQTARTVVLEMAQTVVQRQDGKVVNPEYAKVEAGRRVLERLDPRAKETLIATHGHDKMLQISLGKIESIVSMTK